MSTLFSQMGATWIPGQATEGSAQWWEYAPTGDFTGQQVTLTIAARDLPGHVTEYSQVRTFSA